MCRLAGFVLKSQCQKNLSTAFHMENLEKMRDMLKQGGPDDYGDFTFENVYLGHRRLSIIDTSSAGRQPIRSMCGRWILIYNGEVYNFKDIRDELEAHGHVFQGESDSEVILSAWKKWGVNCLTRFVGMFAFVVLDTIEKKIFLVRDRVGVKPLYIFQSDKIFAFASESKAFHALPQFSLKINSLARRLFFQHGYIPAPYSIREEVFQLDPGCCLTVDVENPTKVTYHKFWDVRTFYTQAKLQISYPEAMEELTRLLDQACALRLISDVPLGIFLSGGVDSSVVLSFLASRTIGTPKTFTVGFKDPDFNEANYARAVASFWKTEHHELFVDEKDCLKVLHELSWIWDEPFGDSSQIPTLFLSRFARQHVKVALSADGGDEMFYGYPKYRLNERRHWIVDTFSLPLSILSKLGYDRLRKVGSWLGQKDRLAKAAESVRSGIDILDTFRIGDEIFAPDEITSLFGEDYTGPRFSSALQVQGFDIKDPVDKMLACDYRSYLPDDILVKVDRATMSTGLEGREPLLDHRLIEFVARLPTEFKRDQKNNKKILKEILWRKIPMNLVERKKMGFGIPLEKWMRKESDLKIELNETCSLKKLADSGFANPRDPKNIIDTFLKSGKNFRRAWLIFSWQKWHKKWLN